MIPKVIVQTARKSPPSYIIEQIRHYSPGWEYKFFNDSDILRFFDEHPQEEFLDVKQKFTSFKRGEHKSDLFRYYYLYVCGGVYFDTDAMLAMNIDEIVLDFQFFTVKSTYFPGTMFQGFIGCEPKNEIIYKALKDAYTVSQEALDNYGHLLCKNLHDIIVNDMKDNENSQMKGKIFREAKHTDNCAKVIDTQRGNRVVLYHYYRYKVLPRITPVRKIAILINAPKVSIFENGCMQQSLFLYETLIKNPNYKVELITADQHYQQFHLTNIPVKPITLSNLSECYDYHAMIFLSGTIVDLPILKLFNENNVKMIKYNCGNVYYIYQEDIIFNNHGYVKDNSKEISQHVSEYWTIPNYEKNLDFFETTYNTPSRVVPYTWNTTVCDRYIQKMKGDLSWSPEAPLEGEQSSKTAILIAEPNMNITKTCMMPLLICERLYERGHRNFKVIMLASPEVSSKTKEKTSFGKFLDSLEIHRRHLIEYYSRMILLDVVKQLKEKSFQIIPLSYQYDNPLNFLHLEMFYLNYPMVHNSEPFKEAGHYYEKINEGVDALELAMKASRKGPEYLKTITRQNQTLLHKYSPNNIEVLNKHILMIENVIEKDVKWHVILINQTFEKTTDFQRTFAVALKKQLEEKGHRVKMRYIPENLEETFFPEHNKYLMIGEYSGEKSKKSESFLEKRKKVSSIWLTYGTQPPKSSADTFSDETHKHLHFEKVIHFEQILNAL